MRSAQLPFHGWLIQVMEAPTPVSAYLHSATMVQAGVYLVARMTPLLGGPAIWNVTLMVFGGATLLWGALAALTHALEALRIARIAAHGVIHVIEQVVELHHFTMGPEARDGHALVLAVGEHGEAHEGRLGDGHPERLAVGARVEEGVARGEKAALVGQVEGGGQVDDVARLRDQGRGGDGEIS